MPTTEALEGIAADLRSRIASLEERVSKIDPKNLTAIRAQKFNVDDLQDELAGVERQLQARKAFVPGALAWYQPARKATVDLANGNATVLPWIGVRRRGQAVRWLGTPNGKKPTVRARVADDYEILVDGAPVSTRRLTRREAAYQAHLGAAGAPHGGRLPAALRLRGRALAKHLHDNRPRRSNRKSRKAVTFACHQTAADIRGQF